MGDGTIAGIIGTLLGVAFVIVSWIIGTRISHKHMNYTKLQVDSLVDIAASLRKLASTVQSKE